MAIHGLQEAPEHDELRKRAEEVWTRHTIRKWSKAIAEADAKRRASTHEDWEKIKAKRVRLTKKDHAVGVVKRPDGSVEKYKDKDGKVKVRKIIADTSPSYGGLIHARKGSGRRRWDDESWVPMMRFLRFRLGLSEEKAAEALEVILETYCGVARDARALLRQWQRLDASIRQP